MGIKGLFKYLLLITFVVSLSACGGGESTSGETSSGETQTIVQEQKSPTTNLVFADQALADCVQSLIDFQGYTLVEQITQLTCSGLSITDIEGIQKLFNLETLDLSSNQIRDITPIAELTKLKSLNLSNNDIQITTPIQELPALEQLDLSESNSIICGEGYDQLKEKFDELPACIDGQQQAQEAEFGDTALKACVVQTAQEIGAQYLEQIQQLKCVNQDISSIEGIDQLTNLRELDLSQNNINDITPLQNLTQLKKVLLGQNQIGNIQPLTSSVNMQELRLDNNQQLTDITPVQALTNLKQLHLTNNSIRDLTPIQGLTELLELRISNNRIIDIQVIANLTKLSSLWIQDNQIANIQTIGQLPNLNQLWLSNNWLTDLSPLQSQTQLKWLHLDGTQAQDLTPLNSLTQLEWLHLENTRVEDITAIYPLTALNWLHLKGNNTIPCSQLDQMDAILTPEKIERPETCSQAQEQQGTPISTIEFNDQDLRDCVYDAAKEQGVINTNELTSLSCNGAEGEGQITDITELQQLPELQNIDLTGNDNIACTQLDDLRARYGYGGEYGEGYEGEYETYLALPESCNSAPSITAEAEQTATAGEQTTITTQVMDLDEDQLTYSWQQTAGEAVELTNANTQSPSFTAPATEQTLEFTLTVTDPYGLTATQTITLIVMAPPGSKTNPFLVTSYEDLKKVGTGIDGWNLDSHYLQTADIDATPSATENEIDGQYLGFQPIGTEETPFTGGYDGGGFTIDGLTINRPEQQGIGLFGFAEDVSFSNINLFNVSISGHGLTGGIVASLLGKNNDIGISNSSVRGEIKGHSLVGGLAGLIAYSGDWVESSHNKVDVSTNQVEGNIFGMEMVGGLVGQLAFPISLITESGFDGVVNGGTTYIGGLSGYISGNSITVINSYADGKILVAYEGYAHTIGGLFGGHFIKTSDIAKTYANVQITLDVTSHGSHSIGGLIGSSTTTAGLTIVDSFATGNIDVNNTVSGEGGTGGLIGSASGIANISNSYATGNISTVGGFNVGGLIGVSAFDGDINEVYAAGDITGALSKAGGLIGYCRRGLIITNSYARGNVTGNSQVGGLVGQMQHNEGDDENPATYSSITNSYSTGQILLQNEELEPVDFGGLVGASTSELNTVSNSFWDIETSGMQTSAGGEPKTSDELKTTTTFTNAGWDFDQTWMILSEGYTYPRLVWNTIEVNSWTDLNNMRNNMHANYVLTRDLLTSDPDYAELAGPEANGGEGWEPVGTGEQPFMGTFDGGGFTIDGLTINRPEENFVGLFGWGADIGVINLNLENIFVNGGSYSGALIGMITSELSNAVVVNTSVVGELSGVNRVGCLAGNVAGSKKFSINNNFTDCEVRGEKNTGGMIGMIAGGSLIANGNEAIGSLFSESAPIGGLIAYIGNESVGISNSSFSGQITVGSLFSNHIGGFAGLIASQEVLISDSFAVAEINAIDEVNHVDRLGGFAGFVGTGSVRISNTYSKGSINLTAHSGANIGGLIGLASSQQGISINNTYTDVDLKLNSTGSYISLVGGLIGQFGSGLHSEISETSTTGSIEITSSISNSFIGGAFGLIGGDIEVTDSYSIGNVSYKDFDGVVSGENIGGFAGVVTNGVLLSSIYASGEVFGNRNIGGLVGNLSGIISNSYANGDVMGSSQVGGLVGQMQHHDANGDIAESFSLIINSYSSGQVILADEDSEPVDFGGLVGASTSEQNIVSNSFWNIETSGQETSAGDEIGLSTEEMQNQYTFEAAGWDFVNTWEMEFGSYPTLQ